MWCMGSFCYQKYYKKFVQIVQRSFADIALVFLSFQLPPPYGNLVTFHDLVECVTGRYAHQLSAVISGVGLTIVFGPPSNIRYGP